MVWSNLRDENMRNGYLRWFGHVRRKVINATVKKKRLILFKLREQKERD